jgi:hypothetical protein
MNRIHDHTFGVEDKPSARTGDFTGIVMSRIGLARYLAVRVIAFIGLTAVSTAVLALPHLG